MASLPSVVLGFVAALVLAPAVERVVPGVFAAVLALGVVGFTAGVVWYLLPLELRNGLGSGTRLLLAAVLVGGTSWLCVAQTPLIERLLFEVHLKDGRVLADFRQWMDAPKHATLGDGSVASGLPLLRFTLGAVAATVGLFTLTRFVAARLPATMPAAARTTVQVMACALLPAVAAALAAPLVEAWVFGGDFRWFLVGTDDPTHGIVYDQRNSLVVGIAMGFAVIPIIYTIAEDALSAIPESLRSAALGCGASPWQAATRVVLPAAVPGIFSAAMIGFGRAIGETMIVLMAAGGTAIMDLTIFNGFRTLSVNIATELPEAPVEGTLYRVLFLAGLLLFAITFVLNTVAELVRLRFRKRFKGL
ncbi:MAG: ABC transporter permease subunit [Planctomycetia bacterium]|nr:ABC transporter permease subunit [Planctomycetia bacterium]